MSVYKPKPIGVLKTEENPKPDVGKVGSLPDLNGKTIEVIEAENNPDIYQYEDRGENRSHKHEEKPKKN